MISLFFHVHHFIHFLYPFVGSMEAFVEWVHVLPLSILVHSCLVKIVILMLVLTSLLYPIFIMGCHKLLFFNLLLLSLWTHLLDVCVTFLTSCVWEGHVLHLVSHLFNTMLMLKLILMLVFSSALPWLTHIMLVEPFLKLCYLHVAQPCVCCKC